MPHLHMRSLLLLFVGLLALILAPAGIAQEETPVDPTDTTVGEGAVIDVPEPAIEIVPEVPVEDEPAWTFRYLIPTSLVLALLVVVGSIVAYFVKVVRTRYRLIQ